MTNPVAPRPMRRSAVVPAEMVPERAGTVAFFSSQTREGGWFLPKLFRIVALFGNVELDLTSARVAPGTSRIEIRAIFGNVEIKVPPEMRVLSEGDGIMGNFEFSTKADPSFDPNAPMINIAGTALFANVEVTVVDPNAPGFFERIALRLKG